MAEPSTKLKTQALKVKVASTNAEERTITAVVSSSNLDRDYERVDVQSLRLPLKGGGYVIASGLTGEEAIDIPMLLNHSFDVEDVIGSVRKAYLTELGELAVVFGISGRAKAQDLMTLIDEGHLDNAFSITMNDYEYSDSTIYNAEIVEISLVFRGSNKDARILAVKSLLKKESDMTQVTEQSLADKKTLLKQLETEIAEAEQADVIEVPAEAVVVEAEVEAPAEAEAEITVPVAVEVIEPVVEADVSKIAAETEAEQEEVITKSIKKDTKDMSEVTEVIAKQVVAAPSEVEQPVIAKKVNKKALRELYVKQMKAHLAGDKSELSKLNAKAMEFAGVVEKAVGFDDGTAIYQSEILSADIRLAYTNVGRVGSLVNRINITGAEKWTQLNEANGTGFQPVGVEEEKQEDKPVWTKLSIEPKEHAVIVAWFDGMAKRTPLAVYAQITKYIARMYADLEDKIILSFAGVTTTGGDVFAPTGLLPILTADVTRVVEFPDYTAAAIQSALGAAYGIVESDEAITLVANRKTWAKFATAVDLQGRNVFTVVGDQLTAGALGTFNVALSKKVADDQVVVGAFNDYTLVTNGGLETLFSREATVGALNLFVSDASAVRANVDIAGKPVAIKSFALLSLVPAVI